MPIVNILWYKEVQFVSVFEYVYILWNKLKKDDIMKRYSIILLTGLLLTGTYSVYAENTPSMTVNASQTQSMEMKNKMLGEEYLTTNKNKPGVITLPNGLQYKIITQGSGSKPTDQDTVTVNYSGTLINGTEFDSSYNRGQPATFPVNAVIEGWTEALKLMNEGSTWELYIPATLAYGERGAPPAIGPNETLIFKINLIKVNKK